MYIRLWHFSIENPPVAFIPLRLNSSSSHAREANSSGLSRPLLLRSCYLSLSLDLSTLTFSVFVFVFDDVAKLSLELWLLHMLFV